MPKIKEDRLCSRFLQSLLQGLFDQRIESSEIFFDFTDEQAEDSGSEETTIGSRRPDGVISLGTGPFKRHLGYVEVKPLSVAKDHHKTNVDLTKLVFLGKDAIDRHQSQKIMVIQAVGLNLIFYLIQRTIDEMYSMFELCHTRFPSSIEEVTMLFELMDTMMNIVEKLSKRYKQ